MWKETPQNITELHLKYASVNTSVELEKAHEGAANCWVPHAMEVSR